MGTGSNGIAQFQFKNSRAVLFYGPMILVIDNYDSFTYNLVQYLGELKVEMQVHRNDQNHRAVK